MRRLASLILVCAASLGSASAHAGKFGMAGCGVGSLIFEDKPGKVQILAATTNQYFVQSSSITSGTSNCTDMGAREEAALYINVNQEALAKDASRGQGESIEGLAKVLQCSNSAQLGEGLKKNYKNIFTLEANQNESVADSIEAAIQKDSALKANCALFS